MEEKQDIQESQYLFPYHWLPCINENGSFSVGRCLGWGMQYLTYMDCVANIVANLSPKNLLDVGCGEGRLAEFLRSRCNCKYVGVDIAKSAIQFAEILNNSSSNCYFKAGSVQEVSGLYDVITLVEVLEHIPDADIDSFIETLKSRLSSNGKLVISVPTKNISLSKKHYRHYDLGELQQFVDKHNLFISKYHYVYRFGLLSKLLRRIVVNRWYVLQSSFLTYLVWKVHRRLTYFAHPTNAAHIVALVERKE